MTNSDRPPFNNDNGEKRPVYTPEERRRAALGFESRVRIGLAAVIFVVAIGVMVYLWNN